MLVLDVLAQLMMVHASVVTVCVMLRVWFRSDNCIPVSVD
jgi:hypothetical protein